MPPHVAANLASFHPTAYQLAWIATNRDPGVEKMEGAYTDSEGSSSGIRPMVGRRSSQAKCTSHCGRRVIAAPRINIKRSKNTFETTIDENILIVE
jgi:hypothetical protein